MPTILQISDPHLLSDPAGELKGVKTWDRVRQVIQRARAEVTEPARIVLTGDLSHEHTVAGYELLRDLLGDWVQRSLLLPGNHDDRSNLRQVFGQVAGHSDEPIGFHDQVGDWHLLGLDSQLPGAVEGELSDSMLHMLGDWLAAIEQRPALVFLHHPPIPVDSLWIDELRLRNPDGLARLIEHCGGVVRGIFCGHVHQAFAGSFARIPLYSAPSASIQFLPRSDEFCIDSRPPGFRVIELQAGRFDTRVVRAANG